MKKFIYFNANNSAKTNISVTARAAFFVFSVLQYSIIFAPKKVTRIPYARYGIISQPLVSTKKAGKLHGLKLMLVKMIDLDTFREKGPPVASIDAVGAGVGEIVMVVSGSSSRQTDITDAKPVDNAIVAIIDHIDIEGKRIFSKNGQAAGS
jgi:ethanolamine utilization protein EutN/carbon dioxide concentrating mechanism protein CcmL